MEKNLWRTWLFFLGENYFIEIKAASPEWSACNKLISERYNCSKLVKCRGKHLGLQFNPHFHLHESRLPPKRGVPPLSLLCHLPVRARMCTWATGSGNVLWWWKTNQITNVIANACGKYAAETCSVSTSRLHRDTLLLPSHKCTYNPSLGSLCRGQWKLNSSANLLLQKRPLENVWGCAGNEPYEPQSHKDLYLHKSQRHQEREKTRQEETIRLKKTTTRSHPGA